MDVIRGSPNVRRCSLLSINGTLFAEADQRDHNSDKKQSQKEFADIGALTTYMHYFNGASSDAVCLTSNEV